MPETVFKDGKEGPLMEQQHHNPSKPLPDANLGFTERSLSAAGAAILSAILVNPLDVAKVL